MKLGGALFIVALPLRASGISLLNNASALRGGMTPIAAQQATGDLETSSVDSDPNACNCDSCVSAYRKNPTAVSDTKCVPSMRIAMGSVCNPQGHFAAKTVDSDVPYHLFCMCHCQPYFSVDSQVAASAEPPACFQMSEKELEQVDSPEGKKAENCEDP